MRNMINKTSIYLLLSILLFGCQKEIDEYFYQETEASVDTDIMSLLKENADYSQFVTLLEQYQVDTLLSQGKIYTFFVPGNSAMEDMEQGTLGDKELIEYLMTESYVNLNQIIGQKKIQTQGGKFALIESLSGSTTFDGITVVKGSPLSNNGRYYEIAKVAQPKPNLYEYIAATNEFYRAYLDSQDSSYLDKELSTPIGYTDDGLTIYDTVLTTVNLFEENYFPVSEEFRDNKATMLLFTQEQYERALGIISDELTIPVKDIPGKWQNEVLMPYLIEQSVFRNALSYAAFSSGRAKNIIGDSVDVNPQNISPDYFECSNGRSYNFIDFQVPEHLYKVKDTIAMSSLLFNKGSGLWGWNDDVKVTGQTFNPLRSANANSTFGSTLLIDMGKDFNGNFSYAYKHQNIFPAKYKLTVRANVSKTGVYNIYVNGKQYPVDINDGNGPQFDFDFFNLRNGVISSVTNQFYPFINSFCRFDILIDNITEFDDIEVRIVYVSPSPRNRNNCGINIDYISLDYFNNNN
jgi:uncharacterized surface protein with fasciclin (FAS1) repeats